MPNNSATNDKATEKHDSTEAGGAGKVNTRPGPQDRGGHGGMATREQEAREQREADRNDES